MFHCSTEQGVVYLSMAQKLTPTKYLPPTSLKICTSHTKCAQETGLHNPQLIIVDSTSHLRKSCGRVGEAREERKMKVFLMRDFMCRRQKVMVGLKGSLHLPFLHMLACVLAMHPLCLGCECPGGLRNSSAGLCLQQVRLECTSVEQCQDRSCSPAWTWTAGSCQRP